MPPRAKKGTGSRDPERPRMVILSELLQIPHHDCARGSTVEKAFLVDVGVALGILTAPALTKYQILDRAYALTHHGRPMPKAYLSSGSTVTDEALQTLINGIVGQGLGRVSLTDGGAAARIALASAEAHVTSVDPDTDDDPFDYLNLSDERREALRSIKIRSGQGAFRESLLRAYGGRCAITQCDVPEVLEAAHIRPYKGPSTNVVKNGILLRADLHRLWDTGRLAVHEASHEVLLDKGMFGSDYTMYAGTQITPPVEARHCPASTALEQQRKWCGL